MARFDGRTVITGAASGLGAACARRFADEGAVVVGFDVTGGAPVEHERLVDVADEAAVAGAVDGVAEWLGHLDGLVTAAGVAGGGPVHLLDADEWARVLGST